MDRYICPRLRHRVIWRGRVTRWRTCIDRSIDLDVGSPLLGIDSFGLDLPSFPRRTVHPHSCGLAGPAVLRFLRRCSGLSLDVPTRRMFAAAFRSLSVFEVLNSSTYFTTKCLDRSRLVPSVGEGSHPAIWSLLDQSP